MTLTREQYLDVDLAIPMRDVLAAGGFEQCMDSLLRRMRSEAQTRAEAVGGELRPARMPEMVVKQATSAIMGDVFVLGSRWLADVPERAHTPSER